MKEILVSGCSFTSKEFTPGVTSWPELLQKDTDLKVVNLGIPGSGNFGICKRATDYIIQSHENIELCVIGLSDWARMENTLMQRKNWSDWGHDIFTLPTSDGIRNISTLVVQNTLRAIYELQLVCKHFNIRCIFIAILNPFHSIGRRPKWGTKFFDALLSNPYFEIVEKDNLVGWPFFKELGGKNILIDHINRNRKKYCLHHEKDGHPNTEGHQLIYSLIKKELNERNISIWR